uniref:Uncharacterized protein n=1 Tax=Cucumis melo TaxID=3656 RepID=A0A9I9EBA2_CUCME
MLLNDVLANYHLAIYCCLLLILCCYMDLDDFSISEEFEYYVMRYMREIVSKDTSIITDAVCFSNVIDTRNSYSQLELDEVQVEWDEFLARIYDRHT